MKWYKKFGYKYNPLEVDPIKLKEEPVSLHDEIDSLLYYVESGNAVLIEGESGSGKTVLLSEVIKNFGGKGRIVYIDGKKINKRLEISQILSQNQGGVRKAMKRPPKGMILLLDNAVELSRKNYEQLQYYFDQDYLKSMVFTTDDPKKLTFPASLFDRIGQRVIKLKPMPMEEAIDLVLDRLDQDLISKDKLEKIYVLSDNNLKTFIYNVNEVLEYMAENDEDDVDMKTLNKIIGVHEDDSTDAMICDECGSDLVAIGVHYRCPECDMYCPECGVLIEYEDYECPKCGVQFVDEDE